MKLYIGNLGDDGRISSDDLRPLFEQYGNVTECECIKNYAFVHMSDENAASKAVDNLNGTTLKGRPIKVEKSESKGPRKPSQKLFVGNIAEGTTSEQLKELFERYAKVLEADVIKNFGFVHIDADAGRGKVSEIVRELHGYNLNGSNIRVQISTSGVRQKPGMGGDQCYRCGRDGHWSKECPLFPNSSGSSSRSGGGGGGGGGGSSTVSGKGGPVRSGGPLNSRGGSNPYRGFVDPYPPPPLPSYMRERMVPSDYVYGTPTGAAFETMPQDPYSRGPLQQMDFQSMDRKVSGGPNGSFSGAPFERRSSPGDYYSQNGGGAMDMGPVRGQDTYFGSTMNSNAYSSGVSRYYSSQSAGGYSTASPSSMSHSDLYSRRSPPNSMMNLRGGLGGGSGGGGGGGGIGIGIGGGGGGGGSGSSGGGGYRMASSGPRPGGMPPQQSYGMASYGQASTGGGQSNNFGYQIFAPPPLAAPLSQMPHG